MVGSEWYKDFEWWLNSLVTVIRDVPDIFIENLYFAVLSTNFLVYVFVESERQKMCLLPSGNHLIQGWVCLSMGQLF